MTDTKTKSVKMTFKALYSYVLNTNYRNIMGILGILLSVGAIVVLLLGWSQLSIMQKVIFFIVAIAFTILNPISLAFKTRKQLKTSPSYKQPLDYTFGSEGIIISQGELSQEVKWSDITRIMLTKSMIAIYTGPMSAFVIPTSELGKDKGRILSTAVQFTADYKPVLSRNLKLYQTGKGI